MEKEELIKKLIHNDGVKSLRFGSTVFKIYEKYLWSNIHSPYFQDVHSSKTRELDIISRAYFKKRRNKEDLLLELLLFSECKSLKDYHIIGF
jgi:hypothetical protein